jgi:hypothetical protein
MKSSQQHVNPFSHDLFYRYLHPVLKPGIIAVNSLESYAYRIAKEYL